MVYITEAHPSDAWQLAVNVRENVVYASPRTDDQRYTVAQACMTKLGIKFPALVDAIGNPAEQAYTGWPDRLYLVDRDGRIAYKSAPGPFGFKPDELRAALAGALLRSQ